MYRSVIIGVSGGRARGLAEAYRHINRANLVAVSSRKKDKLEAFAHDFKVKAYYTDYLEMLTQIQPDLVHVNTPPNVRLEILQAAEEAQIPLVLVEKPLAIQGEDYLAIKEFARTSKTKIAINHQLHFHPRRQALQNLVQEGKIGEIGFIDASSGMNLAYQGTHTLQAIAGFYPQGKASSVFAQISGAEGLEETPGQHFAPDTCLANLQFNTGVSALLRCGSHAPRVIDGSISQHKRIAVYGAKGYVHWTMWGWQTLIDGVYQSGNHEYPEEDILGQAAMTEAMFDWLENGNIHPLNLDAALNDFNIILAIYMSGLQRKPIDLPVEPDTNLIFQLQNALKV